MKELGGGMANIRIKRVQERMGLRFGIGTECDGVRKGGMR